MFIKCRRKGTDLISRFHSAEADPFKTLMKAIVCLVINIYIYIYTKYHI